MQKRLLLVFISYYNSEQLVVAITEVNIVSSKAGYVSYCFMLFRII